MNKDGIIDSNDTGYNDADGDGMPDNTELLQSQIVMETIYQIT